MHVCKLDLFPIHEISMHAIISTILLRINGMITCTHTCAFTFNALQLSDIFASSFEKRDEHCQLFYLARIGATKKFVPTPGDWFETSAICQINICQIITHFTWLSS
eukprot:474497_1